METWREELYHSAKGSTWKNHKYIRKDGKKYIYKETQEIDGVTWDKYVNPDTGETIQKNAGFKYDPERYDRKELAKDIKSDYGESHFEAYAKAGKDFIDRLIAKDKKKTKSDYYVKK